MKKLTPTPIPPMEPTPALDYFIANTLIAHEKDWQKISKLARLQSKKAKR